jgi:DNA-binding XRE family transcriptional regulator
MAKNRCLQALRRICGFTQADLAAEIGVSTRTIVAVENGTRLLTEANARKITYATGALTDSLMNGESPLALNGKPFTKDHWELWKNPPKHGFPDVPSHVEDVKEAIRHRFDSLLEASYESGPGPIFLFAEEFSTMQSRMLENPAVRQRYSKIAPPGDHKSLKNLVESGLIWALWDAEDMGKPEDFWEDPLGAGYSADSEDTEDFDE